MSSTNAAIRFQFCGPDANWPYTLLGIMPTNHRLNAIAPENAGPQSRALLVKWGQLHAIRSALGALATLIFLWCLP